MPPPTIDLHLHPSEETIRAGPLAVRFLITGESSGAAIAAFELIVPAVQRLAAPAHSHDHDEETIYGIEGELTWMVEEGKSMLGRGKHSAFRAAPFTGSITTEAGRQRHSA